MPFGIAINEDGTLEFVSIKAPIRNKGKNLIELPEDYVVIDIETTGLDQIFDDIIEIAAIKVKDGEIIDSFESLVKPSFNSYCCDSEGNKKACYVDDFIIQLTGITNEMLSNAPYPKDILPKFVDFIEDSILLGHNINFDVNFLYDSLMSKLDYRLSNDFVDLMRLSRKIYPAFENHKLATVARNLNIDTSNSHRALPDCETTHKCYSVLCNYVHKNDIAIESLWSNSNKKYYNLQNLESDATKHNPEHLFYDRYCTFTGKLEKLDRKVAAQLVTNIGGHCLNNVTKQTNYLILGNMDYVSNIKEGKSNKLKKAEQLILNGQDLQILSENVFYDLILEA